MHLRSCKALGWASYGEEMERLLRRLGCAVDVTTGTSALKRPTMRMRLSRHAVWYDDLARVAAEMPHPTDHVDPILFVCAHVKYQKCACGRSRLGLGFLWHRIELTDPSGRNAGLGLAVSEFFVDVKSGRFFWEGSERNVVDHARTVFLPAPTHVYVAWNEIGVAVHSSDFTVAFLPREPVMTRMVEVARLRI